MLTTATEGRVAVVRLAHGKVNALDSELLAAWTAELARLERSDQSDPSDAAAVVLTGAGKAFSAGVDLSRLLAGGPEYVRTFLPLLGEALLKTFTFPKPLVAAVNGHAIAGGCILACACDYRLMAAGAGRIGTPELSVGVPLPAVALEILRLVLAPQRLQAVLYRGLTCTPEDALATGFVDELADPDALLERAVEQAAQLGALPSASFALTKRGIRQPARDRIARSLQAADDEVLAAWLSPRVQDAVRVYVARTLRK